MVKQIFVNLSVKELNKSIDFFKALGFSLKPEFSDNKAACFIINDNIYSMLLTEAYFKEFTKKEIINAKNNTEVINAFAVNSRDEVDKMMKKVLAAGGSETREPQEYGWMYGRSFQDIDGHLWEVFHMDESAMKNSKNDG